MKSVIFLASALQLAAAGDMPVTDKNGNEVGKFEGSSGGMKIWGRFNQNQKAGDRSFLKISLSKLSEIDGSGKEVQKMEMSNADIPWSPFEISSDNVFSTNMTQIGVNGVDPTTSFTILAHLSRDQSTRTKDFVRCSNCSAALQFNSTSGLNETVKTKGNCRSITDQTCAVTDANATCPAGSLPCSKDIIVVAYTLKFSFRLSNWKFQNDANKLNFSVLLENKGGKKAGWSKVEGGKKVKVDVDGGFADMPVTGTLFGGATEQIVNVSVGITEIDDKKSTIQFQFPNFEYGKELYYDPTLNPDGISAAAACTPLTALALMATIFLARD